MKIKEEAIKELETLRPAELLKVYDLIFSLKEKKQIEVPNAAYLKVREALRQCRGSLSEDVLLGREDRI